MRERLVHEEEPVTVVAAIYTSSPKDHYFHASMSCGELTRRYRYKVNRTGFVINADKYPCNECWRSTGYDAINDVAATR